MDEKLVFVKLGGSLITDKRERATLRSGVLPRMAHELREALTASPDLRVLLGHGSGSFGHWEAKRYGTRQGVTTTEQWRGFV
ncbi:MAG TPA: uridylate kinase, partial [Anaerolineae bacterium]|nr:uridylate kinase [Anaerolineae bacterium]